MEIKTKFDTGQTVYKVSGKAVKETQVHRIIVTPNTIFYNDFILESELFATASEAKAHLYQDKIKRLTAQRDKLNQQIEELKSKA